MELTRIIQIEATGIVNSGDIGAEDIATPPADELKKEIEGIFAGYDDVRVTIKDFIRDDAGEGAEE